MIVPPCVRGSGFEVQVRDCVRTRRQLEQHPAARRRRLEPLRRDAPLSRPLCCGRTFLSVGLVEEARAEAKRLVAALAPFAARDIPIVGLEPSCLFTLRDELAAMLPGLQSAGIAANSLLFEEFLAREGSAGRLHLAFAPVDRTAYLHGHCHQKAFGAMGAVEAVTGWCPGSFSSRLRRHAAAWPGELSLLPA